jgi:hypothetical protein
MIKAIADGPDGRKIMPADDLARKKAASGMRYFASRTGTRRNLDAIGNAGFGLLVSRAGEWRVESWTCRRTNERRKFHFAADNGAWADFMAEREFDDGEYDRFLDWLTAQPIIAEWLVLPDIVAGGLRSLELSVRWSNRCLSACPLVLLAVQDGMNEQDLAPLVGPKVGVFLGGSTPWKISNMARWGEFCRLRGLHYHAARVNTGKRMAAAIAAGADSADGSSASRYAETVPLLDLATRQSDLFAL